MTPKQVALVQDSFAKVALTSEAAAVLFYDRLFDIAPQMKAHTLQKELTESRGCWRKGSRNSWSLR